MQKVILTATFILALFSLSFGQAEEATTKSGKKIILNTDGTWKYAEEKNSASAATEPEKISQVGNPVVHFEIGCKDLKKTTQFYIDNFGWSPTAIPLASLINTNSGEGVQGHITSLGHEPFNYTTFYIQVADITTALKKIEDMGGKKIIGPITLPDKRTFAWFSDPEGNVVGLITK